MSVYRIHTAQPLPLKCRSHQEKYTLSSITLETKQWLCNVQEITMLLPPETKHSY